MVVAAPDTVRATVGLIAVPGTVTHTASGRVAARVQIYGVDDAFWAFHGVAHVPLSGRESALSESLASELGAANGDALVLRVSGPKDIPLGTLQGRRDDGGTRIRVTLTRTLAADRLGEFSLVAGPGADAGGVRAAQPAAAGADVERARQHHPGATGIA